MKNYWQLTVARRKGVIFFCGLADRDPVKNRLLLLTQETLIKLGGSHAEEGREDEGDFGARKVLERGGRGGREGERRG